MTKSRAEMEALFRHGVLGELVSRALKRGELKHGLVVRAAKVWTDPLGRRRTFSPKTLEEWFYRYRKHGFEGLMPRARRDRGRCRVLSDAQQALILDMKREDPGRSARLIQRELELAGVLGKRDVSVSAIQRLLKRAGLTGPRLECPRRARYRWQASQCGELWQGDALHGPKLFDPNRGQRVRVKIFALLDDRSRLVPFLRAGFHETQSAFLTVLLGAVMRRGLPSTVLLDNHKSFTGSDVQLAAAKLNIRLTYARPYDGPAKGKIERFWRTVRGHVLDRLDRKNVDTLDDLNLRLWAWVEGEYNQRPHASLGGKTPRHVWEEDAEAIRWVEDPARLESAVLATLERRVRHDATCQVRGRTYEVPPALRGAKVKIGYSVLHPDRLWVEDAGTRVPLRIVDPEGNARRRRTRAPAPPAAVAPETGLNAVEAFLNKMIGKAKELGHDDT
jgi:transposase InsO family protein